MGAPVRVDIGPRDKKKVGDLEVLLRTAQASACRELLHTGLAPFRFPRVYAVGGE